MKNWKTTLFGALLAFGLGVSQVPQLNQNRWLGGIGELAKIAGSLGGGFVAADARKQQ